MQSPNDRIENNMTKGDDESSVLSIELQNLRQMNALKRAESAERRKEEVNRIIMMEVAKKSSNYDCVTIESERSKDGNFINHKAVLIPKVNISFKFIERVFPQILFNISFVPQALVIFLYFLIKRILESYLK